MTRWLNFYFITFELLTGNWKIKNFTLSYKFKKWKNKILISKSLEISLLKWAYYSILFEKNVGMLDFVILDLGLALNRYCIIRLLSTYTALCYCVFWKKLLLLACIVVSKCAVFIWILRFQWLVQVHGYKYLQDYRTPFSRCKSNEKWTHKALTC